MPKVQSLRVLSFARFQAFLAALLGVLAGIVYSFGGAIYDLLTAGPNLGTALAFLALVGMPVMFAAVGFVVGMVEALLYNIAANRFGGLEVRFDQGRRMEGAVRPQPSSDSSTQAHG